MFLLLTGLGMRSNMGFEKGQRCSHLQHELRRIGHLAQTETYVDMLFSELYILPEHRDGKFYTTHGSVKGM